MKPIQLFSSLILLTFFCDSCSVYTPNALNVPLLKDKGDVSVAFHAGNGGNLQAAYGLTNNLGIMVNYMGVKSEVTTNATLRKGDGRLVELGLGYFSHSESKMKSEIYGGGGFGGVDIIKTLDLDKKTFNVSATKFFLQPSIGHVGKHFEIAFSTRLTMVKFNKLVTTYNSDELLADKFVDIEKPTWLFIEPAITMRLGFEHLKFQLQFGKSFKSNKQDLGYDSGILNFGLIGRF